MAKISPSNFLAVDQNLARRKFAFHATKKLPSQHFSTLLFLLTVSINKETVHFFPPELKKNLNKLKDNLSMRRTIQLYNDAVPINIVLLGKGSAA